MSRWPWCNRLVHLRLNRIATLEGGTFSMPIRLEDRATVSIGYGIILQDSTTPVYTWPTYQY